MELLRILVILVQMLSLSLCGPAGQYFSSEPADTTAVAGGHLQLECVVENRKGQCQWTKDGFGLGLDPDIPGFSMSDCNLNIFPISSKLRRLTCWRWRRGRRLFLTVRVMEQDLLQRSTGLMIMGGRSCQT